MGKKTKTKPVQKQEIFDLKKVVPLTVNQEEMFSAYKQGHNLMVHGYAGVGKTYIALYLALQEVLQGSQKYDKIIIIRSVVPARDIGFLPGSIKEKTRIYEEPYKEMVDDLFGRGDGYEILKLKKIIDFTTTSFLRGTTFNNAIVIADETQNFTFQECDTIMTRMGDTSRVIFCGDYRQSDLNHHREKSGIKDFINITKNISLFKHIEFTKEEIIRSRLVKEYIIQKAELGYD